jgi:hypothetical protein
MSVAKSNTGRPMVVVVPPEAVRVLDDGDTIADPGVWYGQVGEVQFQATISRAVIEAGPAWTPKQALPLPLDRAGAFARTVLTKLVRKHERWKLSEITLYRLRDGNPERWFYVVGFVREAGRISQQGAVLIPVAFSGEVGMVTKVLRS